MISEIAYHIVKSLAASTLFIDKWAGLVMPMKKSVNKIEKVLPVFINSKDVCDVSDFMDLVPDSTKKSICYCEKINDVRLEPLPLNNFLATADLRIVLWYNLNLTHNGDYLDEGVIAYNILSNMPKRLSDTLFAYCKNVRIYPIGTDSGADLFSAYSYDEVRTQFVTFPYGAIAVNVSVQYTINKCALDLVPESACGFPPYVPTPPEENINFDYELDFNVQ